jgi:arylsulfatase
MNTSRRDFLKAAGAGAAALVASAQALTPTQAGAQSKAPGGDRSPYNILFILVDQQRHFRPRELPEGFALPAQERLMERGTTFLNHRINSCVCTPSRSVIYTGLHMQHTKMFDNTNFP